LLQRRILPHFSAGHGPPLRDAANLDSGDAGLALTTDAYVVSPLFFPGGDIGRLAVFGTANDLAMVGAQARWLSLALIIEEGFPLQTLDRVLRSAASAAEEAGIQVVTGDTKVVPRGAADGLFITTSGVGCRHPQPVGGSESIQVGDVLICSGPIAQHGMAVMAARESLGEAGQVTSDCGWLWPAVQALLDAQVPLKALRDATRGGIAAVLHEWADDCGLTLSLNEAQVPITPPVRGLCEVLGIDPVFVANEGTMLLAVAAANVPQTLAVLHSVPISQQAAVIGQALARDVAPVVIRRALPRLIPLDQPSGGLLPRIC
jgi:hydrogenase expression/formation protein HypE